MTRAGSIIITMALVALSSVAIFAAGWLISSFIAWDLWPNDADGWRRARIGVLASCAIPIAVALDHRITPKDA